MGKNYQINSHQKPPPLSPKPDFREGGGFLAEEILEKREGGGFLAEKILEKVLGYEHIFRKIGKIFLGAFGAQFISKSLTNINI